MTAISGEDVAKLLARVEAATGPLDPETACRIDSLGFGEVSEFSGPYRGDCGEDEFSVFVTDHGVRRQRRISENDLPDRSVDDALAMVERLLPDWRKMLQIGTAYDNGTYMGHSGCSLYSPISSGTVFTKGFGPTTPLAILAALLRALSQSGKQP